MEWGELSLGDATADCRRDHSKAPGQVGWSKALEQVRGHGVPRQKFEG
jgi:hypothetical protein